ncbi:MAG: 23S rRNA (guanosine(2251)-2'-O)-methyltransferase RlmB [Alphaproteobacteria bacterium]|nr:23S rRNA (guanosine(2251)-2'-O)-methyltransferase RlmB [Alphaproteobacteria bacterium]
MLVPMQKRVKNHHQKSPKPSAPKHAPTLYGAHAVREAWLNPARDVQALYLTPQSVRGFEALLQEAQARELKRPSVTVIEKEALERILPKGAVHQGIALCASGLPESDVQDFIIQAHGRPRTVLAMLDQVTDPHNVGAILRSASAFGLHGVLMQKKHAPLLEGVLAKTACGAVEHIPVAQETNLSRAIENLKDEGFYVIGLDERGEQTIGKAASGSLPDRIVLVLGAEGGGIRRLIQENCDVLVRLPTGGAIASLNVSNAAAVAFYALAAGG